ncbi:hypothetical protein OQA88_7516 [Cercophora sp. LCS_1]
MTEYRANPSWAILPPSDMPDGSEAKVLEMLGSVVPDFEHPLHEMLVAPATNREKGGVMRVEDADFRNVVETLANEDVTLRLTQLFGGKAASGGQDQQQFSAKRVITRTLENHRQFFDEVVKHSHDKILKMAADNPRRTSDLYMIVGIKTCIDAHVSSRIGATSLLDAGVKIPLRELLQAAAIPVPVDLTIDLGIIKKTASSVFNQFSLQGERIFAVQYRRISVRNKVKLRPTPHREKKIKYKDIHTVHENRGMYGAGPGGDKDEEQGGKAGEAITLEDAFMSEKGPSKTNACIIDFP